MNSRRVPVAIAIALLASPSLAMAKGQSDDQPPPSGPPSPVAPGTPAAAPSDATQSGTSAGATLTLGAETNPLTAKDEPSTKGQGEGKKESNLAFRGSTFLFDQSVTTQTAHVETSPQLSYVPLYEWWLSFRPRYYFNEHFYLWARVDFFKEFTNHDETTLYRQNTWGDVWTDIRYTTPIPAINKGFVATTGIRAKWPLSLESQGAGIFITPGAFGTVQQKIPINGESAKFLNEAEITANVTYEHPFSRATTPTNPSLQYARQSTDERSFTFLDNQLSGTPLANHTVLAALHGGLAITPKLSASLDMIWINQWHYAATGDVTVAVSGGGVTVPRSSNDSLFTQRTWFIANLSYDLLDELALGLGYYNLASELAPNGQRRGIAGGDVVWWSPDARLFFDVTVNLDRVYEFASGKGKKASSEAKASASERNAQRVRQF